MKKNRRGIWLVLCGLLLIVADVALVGYNMYEANSAARICQKHVQSIEEKLQQNTPQAQKSEETVAVYEVFPEVEMPTIEVEDKTYIGILQIPELGLELPVQKDWSYARLKQTPCCYKGSVYQDNMIIAAHNYAEHFGKIGELNLQDQIIFTDAAGNVFVYEVANIEVLSGTALEEMESGEWDMTLFTCTIGGENRVTVRCESIE